MAQGGVIRVPEPRASHGDPSESLDSPRVSICYRAPPSLGKACRGAADCERARCMCTGDLAGPLRNNLDAKLKARDGKPAVGRCEDDSLIPGKWFCMVKDGKANLRGIIID